MRSVIAILLIGACSAYARDDAIQVRQAKVNALVCHVKDSLEKAETCNFDLPQRILDLPGYSGHKVKHFLYYLTKWPNGCYLEVGCFYGSTLIAALYQNTELADAVAIDNWSEFGGPKQEFQRNCAKEIPNAPLRFYEQDCFAISKQDVFKMPISFYFYDGRHEFLDQKMAFTYFDDVFDDVFVAVVDDWNWSQVQDGTREAFKELGYRVHFAKEIFSDTIEREHWWNGLLIAVIEKGECR